jgi:hypothetical protein
MKIGATPQRHPTASAPLERPFASFAQLLGRDDRALGFAELGMFGISRATGDHAAALSASAQGVPPRGGNQEPPLETADQPPEQAKLHRRIETRIESGSPTKARLRSVAAPLSFSGTGGAVSAEAMPSCPFEASGEDAAAGGRAPSRRMPLDPRQPGVSLIMSETNGAVQLVAGARPFDPDGAARLRRALAELLAAHGLKLADFQLNGTAVSADVTKRKEPPHGSRPD